MAQTPYSASSSYITAANFLECYSQSIVGDMLRATPDSPPPSYSAIIDPNNPAGARLYKHLKIGAGEIEAYCAVARRYTPDDLTALTGVSRELLEKLNAARGMWSLKQYLQPITARPDDVPFAKESAELLKLLGLGEMIFGFSQSMDAGLPSVVEAQPAALVTPNVISYAQRLFPTYGSNRLLGGGS